MTTALQDKRIAFVHDWLTTFGGAERVVALWKELFPDAPIHTLVYDQKNLGHIFPPDSVIPSRIQRWPFSKRYYRKLLPFMPRAFEEFDFSNFDIVLSSSSSCAKGILTSSSTFHASYVHSPMRYAWDLYPEYLRSSGPITRHFMRQMMPDIRLWDQASANRVDLFLCNSQEVARRIRKTYRREATVIHPPIETGIFTPKESAESPKKGSELGEAYLCVGRLIPYKRVDLAVKACTKLNRRLDIIGNGAEMKHLKSIAGPSVRFLGFQSDDAIRKAYQECRGFLFPGLEDFGMTPLEAQSSGRPVIAFGRGGALETVSENQTGLFHQEQSTKSLISAMEQFESQTWNPLEIRKHALNFDRSVHISRIQNALIDGYKQFCENV
ncbi:MAG: glycosyltransferase [Spirochaetales bacterium]|nr:glycosyltransferase [Spirochaetales bacterium]